MRIKFRLYATLQDYLPPGSDNCDVLLDLPEGATVPDALAVFFVPIGLAHIVLVNNRHVLRPALFTRQLKDGDRLAVFPAIGGG